MGRGVKQDMVEAIKWHLIATPNGRKDEDLDMLLKQVTPAQLAEAKNRASDWIKNFLDKNKRS